MAGEPILAHGTVVQMGNGAVPEVFTTIANRTDIKLKPPVKVKADCTHHDSTDRDFVKGFEEGGEATFAIYYHPSNAIHRSLRDEHDGDTATNFKVTMRDGTVLTFAAFVFLVDFDFGVANKIQQCSVRLEMDGGLSYADP